MKNNTSDPESEHGLPDVDFADPPGPPEQDPDATTAVTVDLELPPIVRGKTRSVGLQRVRRNDIAEGPRPRQIDAYTAGEASELFGRAGKGGGAAFARWCILEGLRADHTMSGALWRDLLELFANRPLHGHRRTAAGGNHRPNRHHLR